MASSVAAVELLKHTAAFYQLQLHRRPEAVRYLESRGMRDFAIIEALEERNTELAEKRARDHTLGLAAYVEAHGQELF